MSETAAEQVAREEMASRTRITLRPIAGPLALGFFGLAAATVVMSGLQLGWIEPTEGKQVALCILAFTVPLQFTASLFGFLARDAVAATGMGLLSGIWAVVGLVTFTGKPGSTSHALGLFLSSPAGRCARQPRQRPPQNSFRQSCSRPPGFASSCPASSSSRRTSSGRTQRA
jgi:hypothetical protein